MTPHGIMFHHFHDGQKHIKGQGSISAEQLDGMIKFIKKDNIILSADEWMNKAQNKNLKEHEICLTFDDNLLCQYEIAYPVLKKHNIKAFWFIYTSPFEGVLEKIEIYRFFRFKYFQTIEDFYNSFYKIIEQSEYGEEVSQKLTSFNPPTYLKDFPFYTDEDRKFRYVRDKILQTNRYYSLMDLMLHHFKVDLNTLKDKLWMTEENIRELYAEGHKIGLHTHTHPTSLASLEKVQQKCEYETNLDILSKILGQTPECMSHPCNSYNEHTIDILKDLNIKLGFRANMVDHLYTNFEFPREDHANILKKMRM